LRTLAECRLYGIIDLSYIEARDVNRVAQAMVEGSVDMVQLRGKDRSIDELSEIAAGLHRITFASGTPLLVNDHPEIAKRVPVEGVHVGQDDESIASVRGSLERKVLVGKSTHNLAQAVAAEEEGADYIGFGPLFATPTKPDYQPIGLGDIEGVHRAVRLPIFCIGGIKVENLAEVVAAGAKRVVIVSGLLKAKDIPHYALACKKLLAAAI
jgi:thiamine-phosphate pyrophosphorylase